MPLKKKEARRSAAPLSFSADDYGFFFIFMLSAFIMESFFVESIIIFMPVSAVAAGAGAGAMAGVVVSLLASSDVEHAVTASTAATKARRFMTFS